MRFSSVLSLTFHKVKENDAEITDAREASIFPEISVESFQKICEKSFQSLTLNVEIIEQLKYCSFSPSYCKNANVN